MSENQNTAQVALVTGASRGIGRAIAETLAEAGARVIGTATTAAGAAAIDAWLGSRGRGACVDVASAESVDALLADLEVRGELPGILVNNAGIAKSNVPAEETSDDHWRVHMDINLDGVFWCCRAFGRQMLAAGRGSIVNIGSISGFIVNKPQPQAFYNASKAAVHHLTRFLAAHLTKERILCNAIAPGPYPTWMLSTGVGFGGETENADWDRVGRVNPSGRVGTPEDIAGLAIFLSSRAGEYVVGQVIASDGGAVGTS